MDIKNTYAKYERPVSYSKKVMVNVQSRSKVTVKVSRSKFMLPLERPCHKEHICQYESLTS